MNRLDISRLQKNRSIYFKLGMITALSFVLFAFNWDTHFYDPDTDSMEPIFEEEAIPVVRTQQLEKRLPPPPVIETSIEPILDDPELIMEPEPEPVAHLTEPVLPEPLKPRVIASPKPAPRPKPMPLPEEPKEKVPDLFQVVEEMPRFPGCEEEGMSTKEKKACADRKMMTYIYEQINYPTLAVETGIEGTAVIRFVIEKDGSITDLQIVKEPGGGCGREALRVVKGMPNWLPGKQRNRAVRVQYNLPIKYQLR